MGDTTHVSLKICSFCLARLKKLSIEFIYWICSTLMFSLTGRYFLPLPFEADRTFQQLKELMEVPCPVSKPFLLKYKCEGNTKEKSATAHPHPAFTESLNCRHQIYIVRHLNRLKPNRSAGLISETFSSWCQQCPPFNT